MDFHMHKKPDVFGGRVNKNGKNTKIGPIPHNEIDSCNPKCAWVCSSMAAKVKAPECLQSLRMRVTIIWNMKNWNRTDSM